MKIVDWFDIKDVQHLKAYQHLQKTGSWPMGFIPADVEISLAWQIEIIAKFANAYIEQQLIGK